MTYSRMSTIEFDSRNVEEVIAFAGRHVDRVAGQQHGFKGQQLFINREAGRAYSITLWDSEASARAADGAMVRIRTDAPDEFARMGVRSIVTEVLDVVTKDGV